MPHFKPKPNQPPVCMRCKKAKQACTWDQAGLKLALMLQPTDQEITQSRHVRKDTKSSKITPTTMPPSSLTSKLPKAQSSMAPPKHVPSKVNTAPASSSSKVTTVRSSSASHSVAGGLKNIDSSAKEPAKKKAKLGKSIKHC